MNLSSIQDFWSNLTTGQKAAAGAAVAGVVSVAAAIMYWAGQPKMELLYGGLSDDDMTKIVSVVEASGTKFKTSETGNGVQVLKKDVHKLRMELAKQGLPSDKTVGLELFGSDPGKLGASDFEQKLQKMRAIQGELARTIMEIEGVKNARLQIAQPETRLIKTNPNDKPTVSVFVDTGHLTLDEQAISGIRYLVSSSVEGVALEDVSIVDNHGNPLHEAFLEDGVFGEASGNARFASKMEAAEAKKIETQLEKIVGKGNVVARVSIELDMKTQTVVEQDWDPDDSGSLIKKEMHDQDSLSSRERSLGDRGVGETQNDPQGLPGTLNDLPATQTDEDRESKTTEYIADNTVTETVTKPGTRSYITASVFISNTDTDGNQIKNNVEQLKRNIASTIGLREDAEGTGYLNGRVDIAEVSFYRPAAIPTAFGDKWEQTMQEYEPLINFLIGLLVAVAALVVFFKIMNRFRAEDQPEVEIIDDSGNGETAAFLESPYEDGQAMQVPALTDALTPELLNELIRERSQNVGSALREYMNKK